MHYLKILSSNSLKDLQDQFEKFVNDGNVMFVSTNFAASDANQMLFLAVVYTLRNP